VLEVGMGGRLDSTNICRPLVSIITSISFDHTRQLGNTLAAIAREKAGIIKPGVPVVSGVTDEEPRAEIEAIARQCGSPLDQLGREFVFCYHSPAASHGASVDGSPRHSRFDFIDRRQTPERLLAGIELSLLGRHQAANAAVAIAAAERLQAHGLHVPESAIRRALAAVRWPARIEVVGERPTIVVDAAHNLASIAALVETLEECFTARRRILVFASTKEKDTLGMLRLLLPRFDRVILTRYTNNPRNLPPEELAAQARELGVSDCIVADSPRSAWAEVLRLAEPDDLVCVTGSFFIAAEMRDEIDRAPLPSR
jgi:dihydrofolate synthase/folylpolyglutamate synthase